MKEQPDWTPVDYCKFDSESQAELHRAAIKEWDQLTLVWERINEQRKAAFGDPEDLTKEELYREMSADYRAILNAFRQAGDFVDRYLQGVERTWGAPRRRPR